MNEIYFLVRYNKWKKNGLLKKSASVSESEKRGGKKWVLRLVKRGYNYDMADVLAGCCGFGESVVASLQKSAALRSRIAARFCRWSLKERRHSGNQLGKRISGTSM
ncbi:MAG: hypothetical protein II507_12230, partial [Treponema sp.]|nr:hypothetical protein [Treponema sp.]